MAFAVSRFNRSMNGLGVPFGRSRLLDRELDRRYGPKLAREAGKITIEGLDARRPMRRSGNHRIAERSTMLVSMPIIAMSGACAPCARLPPALHARYQLPSPPDAVS
jgi:hypothetical protein